MVMECRPGYAVVVDEDGRFLKVANRHYTVGQTVTDVVRMQLPAEKKNRKWLYSLAAMAACLALVLSAVIPGMGQQPYASVYVKINPEVRIDVDKNDRVVGLDGVNQDGIDLIAGYDYHKKDLDLVTDELVDRAIDMGYLHDEGQITISLDSADQVWVDHHSQSLPDQLQNYLQNRIVVTIQLELDDLDDLDDLVDLDVLDDDLDDPDGDDDLDDEDDWDDPDDDDEDDWDDSDDDDDLDEADDRDDSDDDDDDYVNNSQKKTESEQHKPAVEDELDDEDDDRDDDEDEDRHEDDEDDDHDDDDDRDDDDD